MSESNREPDIYLKDFKIEGKGETTITVENGKICISGSMPSITAQELKVNVEVGKVCGEPHDIEAERRWNLGVAIQILTFAGAVALTYLITGLSLGPTGNAYWIILGAGLFMVVLGFVFSCRFFKKGRRRVTSTKR